MAQSDGFPANGAQNSNFQKVRSDFKQLSDALSSGAVDQAQQALSSVKGHRHRHHHQEATQTSTTSAFKAPSASQDIGRVVSTSA